VNIDFSQFSPYLLILAGILVIIVIVGLIRFFWHHILRYVFQGCLVIVGILIVLALLRYFFKF
jgi:hypothetical protein